MAETINEKRRRENALMRCQEQLILKEDDVMEDGQDDDYVHIWTERRIWNEQEVRQKPQVFT